MDNNIFPFDDARSIVGLTGILMQCSDQLDRMDRTDYLLAQDDQSIHQHMMEIKSKLSARDQMRLFDYIYRRAK